MTYQGSPFYACPSETPGLYPGGEPSADAYKPGDYSRQAAEEKADKLILLSNGKAAKLTKAMEQVRELPARPIRTHHGFLFFPMRLEGKLKWLTVATWRDINLPGVGWWPFEWVEGGQGK